MSKYSTLALCLVTLGLIAGFQNCGNQSLPSASAPPSSSSPNVQMVGLVQKPTATQSLQDGCQVLICSSQGTCVVPVNWNSSGFNNGDTVSIQGIKRTDMVSICLAGDLVEITSAQAVAP